MQVYTDSYILEKEILSEISNLQKRASETKDKLVKELFRSVRRIFKESTLKHGSTRVIDERILPSEAKVFLHDYNDKLNLTDLENTVSVKEFMSLTGINKRSFVPKEMVVVSRSTKKDSAVPVLIRLNDEFMYHIKKGKRFYYLGNRAIGAYFRPKEYFYTIISIENKETNSAFYFGVW